MINKPKFMSPSINMYGNTVIDLNSTTLPFSCVVDGNEAIKAWQIRISRLSDNVVVFDTGEKTLNPYFYPINNRNQNVTFTIDLKESFASATTYHIKADKTYDKSKAYYALINGEKNFYQYNGSESTPTNWSATYSTLYYTNFVNSSEPYYWSITLQGSNGSTICSAEEVFYANSTPQIAIHYSYYDTFSTSFALSEDKDAPSKLVGRRVFFKANYSQDENIPVKRYGWRLTDSSNGNVFVDTISKNQIYGLTEDISFECNGLVSGNSYLLELYIETQNNQFEIAKKINFDVSYRVQNLEANFDIRPLNDTSGIMLNWGELKTTEGVVVGKKVSYIEDNPLKDSISIQIPENSSVVFEGTSNDKKLEIDEDAYVVISFQFDKFKKSFTLFNMSGLDKTSSFIERNLYYNHLTNKLEYTITKRNITLLKTIELSNDSGQRCWYVVTLHPMSDDDGYDTDIKVVQGVAVDSLLPNDDVFPSEDEYAYFGDWNEMREKEDE